MILNIEGPHPFGSHPLVSRFVKGIYETRKPQPKDKTIWDVAIVLKHLKTLDPLEELSLKDLTLKLLLLLLLATGQRGQTVYLLSLDGMTMSPLSCTFDLLEHIKSSKPSKRTNSIDIHGYQADNALCPLLTLKEYLTRTAPLRGTEKKLFVSFIQPHKGVFSSQFTAHSTRAATSSEAKERDLPLDIILATAGWGSAATFQKFYHNPIIQQPTLADTVLQM